MALTTIITVNEILNRVAAEVGIAPVNDPFASANASFIQMRYLLNTAGEELQQAYPWEALTRQHAILTDSNNNGSFPLPDDFGYLVNQTGWERAQSTPLGGPLSAQDWAYLNSSGTQNESLFVSFRFKEGKFCTYPSPAPSGLDINFEYISCNWVTDGGDPAIYRSAVQLGSDKPLFDKTLITRYVKLKYLESTGFDTTKAQDDFTQTFNFLTGFDKAAPILSMAGRRSNPYLSAVNIPSQNYGV